MNHLAREERNGMWFCQWVAAPLVIVLFVLLSPLLLIERRYRPWR